MTQTGAPVTECNVDGQLEVERAIEHDSVDYDESTYEHDDPDHCEVAAAGRVVVGVTDDEGEVLLVIDEERGVALLPNGVVEANAQFLDVAEHTVEELIQTPVAVETVNRVRQIEHRANGVVQEQTDHVVVSATPTEPVGEVTTPDDGFGADWYGALPADADAVGDGLADIRLYLPE